MTQEGRQRDTEGNVKMGQRERDGHKSRNASRGQKLEEARDKLFPRAFRGSTAL